MTSPTEEKPTLDEILAPVRQQFLASGMTEEELTQLVKEERHSIRQEKSSGSGHRPDLPDAENIAHDALPLLPIARSLPSVQDRESLADVDALRIGQCKGKGFNEMALPKIIEIMLPAELEEYAEAKVTQGEGHSLSEIVHEALWRLQDLDELRRIKQERLRKEIQKGLDSESKPFTDEDFAAMRRDLRERQGEHLKTYWISVGEQLPSTDCLALVAAGEYIGVAEWSQGGWMEIRREDAVMGLAHRITHWMPLPAPPAPEKAKLL